jgi:hypothetical protein
MKTTTDMVSALLMLGRNYLQNEYSEKAVANAGEEHGEAYRQKDTKGGEKGCDLDDYKEKTSPVLQQFYLAHADTVLCFDRYT